MTDAETNGPGISTLTMQTRLATAFVGRQFVLLTLIAVLVFPILYFFKYFQYTWDYFWQLGSLDLQYFPPLPIIIVLIFGYVYFFGILFSLVPSERSFQFFLNGLLFLVLVLNHDHSVIDWIAFAAGGSVAERNPVSVFKLIPTCALLGAVVVMHYNILSDDFTRRMIRRGIPTEEAARIRPGMMKALLPLLFACAVVAVGLGLVGEFSALLFQTRGLFPKFEIVLLGGLGIAIGFVLRGIIKELYQKGGSDEDERPVEAAETEPTAEENLETPNG